MTNTTIFAIIALTSILLLGTSIVQAADHGDAPLIANDQGADKTTAVVITSDDPDSPGSIPIPYPNIAKADAPAIPKWVQFSMQAYLNGDISERELLDAFDFLKKQGIMHESQEAAQEMADLRAENAAFKKLQADGLVGSKTNAAGPQIDPSQTPVIVMPSSAEDREEALNHLRKAYDLNPNLQTKIMQYDKDHKDWIIIESWSWGESTAGDPDRPIITGHIPNPEQTGDMVLKGSKIHENAPTHDGGTVIVFTGLEFASETVHDLVNNGETSTTGWEEGVAAFTSKNYGTTSASDGVHELGHALGMMDNAIEKEIMAIEGELAILEELTDMYTSSSTSSTRASTQYGESDFEFIQRHLNKIDTKIQSLQTGLRVLDDMMSTAGDDAQLANIDLQNSLQKQQQTLQTISNTSKMLHDTTMSIIRKIG